MNKSYSASQPASQPATPHPPGGDTSGRYIGRFRHYGRHFWRMPQVERLRIEPACRENGWHAHYWLTWRGHPDEVLVRLCMFSWYDRLREHSHQMIGWAPGPATADEWDAEIDPVFEAQRAQERREIDARRAEQGLCPLAEDPVFGGEPVRSFADLVRRVQAAGGKITRLGDDQDE